MFDEWTTRALAINAVLSGHLAVLALLVINLSAGSVWGALMAPLGWALVQVREWITARRGPPTAGEVEVAVIGVYASQLAAAVLALVA